jgi:ketosteroid isomerase-like protein
LSNLALEATYEYIRRMNRRDFDRLSELFSEDAVFYGPFGMITGRAAIHEVYTTFQSKILPTIWLVSAVTEGNRCVFEFECRLEGETRIGRAIDHFTVDGDGKITQFIMYQRPPDAPIE